MKKSKEEKIISKEQKEQENNGIKGFHNTLQIIKYLKPYKKLLTIFVLLTLVTLVISFFRPQITENVMTALTNGNWKDLLISAAILAGISIFSQCIYLLNIGIISSKFISSLTFDLRSDLLQKSMLLKVKNFEKTGSGKFMRVIDGDASSIGNNIINNICYISDALSMLFVLGYAVKVDVWIGLYLCLQFLVMLTIRYAHIQYRTKKSKEIKELSDDNASMTAETIRGIRDIKTSALESSMLKKSNIIQGKLRKKDYEIDKIGDVYFRIERIINACMTFGFWALIALFLYLQKISPAAGLTLFAYSGTIGSLAHCITTVIEFLKKNELSSFRINKILNGYDYGFEENGNETIELSAPKDIVFENVSFQYEDKPVLNNLNIKIKEKSTVGIVGESGNGKTTMIKLISRMYDANSGRILVAGKDINSLDRKSLLSTLSVVPQDPYIFNFSFEENLRLVKPEATDEEIIDACKKAQLHDFIVEQKESYKTKLGENGITLSGGQKQRLAIARALLRDTPILIFDEATSSLDNENQEKIKKVISNLNGEKTVVIVAHRLSTIRDVDEIIYIKEGKVSAKGTHDELMKKSEDYSRLYKNEG